MKPSIQESISMQKEAENIYINIKDAYESGMSHWKEALLVSWRQDLHPIVKEHVKFLILENKKNKNKK
jgi:hypothetical protein